MNMAITTLRDLNRKNLFTREQLMSWKKFQGKHLNVYPHHYDYWKDGIGFETVYEVRDVSEEVRENYQTVEEILHHA